MFKDYLVKASTNISTLSLNIPQSYKQQCIEEAYRLGDSMNQSSNVKAIMSSWYVWDETQIFNLLLDNISNYIFSTLKHNLSSTTLNLQNAWSAIYKKGHFTNSHCHLPSFISFVYYLKSNGNTPIIFDECGFSLHPKDDTLVFFPSYLTHSVPVHEETEDRVVIAGNIDANWKT
jgi:hypothetical protein